MLLHIFVCETVKSTLLNWKEISYWLYSCYRTQFVLRKRRNFTETDQWRRREATERGKGQNNVKYRQTPSLCSVYDKRELQKTLKTFKMPKLVWGGCFSQRHVKFMSPSLWLAAGCQTTSGWTLLRGSWNGFICSEKCKVWGGRGEISSPLRWRRILED